MGALRDRVVRTAPGIEKPPAGFKSAKEWAAVENCDPMTVRRMFAALVSRGQAEVRPFRVLAPDGRPYPVPHYRLIPVSGNKKGRK